MVANSHVRGFALTLGQLFSLRLRGTYRESLSDIEACLGAQAGKLYHIGIRSSVARNTLANAMRAWRVYADLAQSLIEIARRVYSRQPLGVDLKDTVYALDANSIDLCLSVFPWVLFRLTKAAIKLHTLLVLRGNPLPPRAWRPRP
jgi:Domain of unknown function (DUF4372)